jgi:hypothetical protein
MKRSYVIALALLVAAGGSISLWHSEWFQRRFFPETYWRQQVNERQKNLAASELMLSNMAIEVEKKRRTADLDVMQMTGSARALGMDSELASKEAAERVSQEIKGLTEGYQIVREMLEKNRKELAEAETQLARYTEPRAATTATKCASSS